VNSVQKASITSDLAHRMIAAAEAKATEMERAMSIVIVDESGVTKSLSRMDGAPLMSVKVAEDKAFTAVGFGFPSHAWFEMMQQNPSLAAGAVGGIGRLVVMGGGYPIVDGDVVIGAVGVSGGMEPEDMAVSEAALAAVAGS
jgi:uncharacterized protein GlcG (DUF336 family)